MSFNSLLTQQQSRINAACEDYREWNRKLNHLINQIEIADAWENDAIAKLNQELEIAANETQQAMRVWDAAMVALDFIPINEPALATARPALSYLESKGYREESEHCIWEPMYEVDLEPQFDDFDCSIDCDEFLESFEVF